MPRHAPASIPRQASRRLNAAAECASPRTFGTFGQLHRRANGRPGSTVANFVLCARRCRFPRTFETFDRPERGANNRSGTTFANFARPTFARA